MFRTRYVIRMVVVFILGTLASLGVLFVLLQNDKTSAPPTDSSREVNNVRPSIVFADQDLAQEGRVVTFVGQLFSEATTTIFLYRLGNGIEPEEYRGTFAEDSLSVKVPLAAREGFIEGRISPMDREKIELRFFDQISSEEIAQATTTILSVGGLAGSLFEPGKPAYPFELKKTSTLPGGIGLSIRHLKSSIRSSPLIDVCDFEATYPVTDDQEINQLIQKALSSSTTKNIEEEAEKYITNCKLQATDRGNIPHESGLRVSHRIETQVTLNQNGILSFFIRGWDWGGGAHEVKNDQGIAIDLEKKRLISLQDLVPVSQLRDFLAYQKQWTLLTSFAQLHEWDNISEEEFARIEDFTVLRSFVSSTQYLSVLEQERLYGGLQDFFLTPSEFVKYYNSYELGAWMNTPKVGIPYQGQAFFSSSALLKRLSFIQQNIQGDQEAANVFIKQWSEIKAKITTSTPKWLTFTSSKYGYSVSYPPEFLTEIDPRELHQTQSSPDRPEALHDFALYFRMPEGFPSSLLVQVTRRGEWKNLLPYGYRPLVSDTQWDEEKAFLSHAQVGDGCDFFFTKYFPETTGYSRACRVITVNGATMLDRQFAWSPSMMIGRVATFYKNGKRFDINLPNGFYDYLPFTELDRIKTGTVIEIGERILGSMRFTN